MPDANPNAERIEQAAQRAGQAKDAWAAAEAALGHANRGSYAEYLIAFGVMVAQAERYVEALRLWRDVLGE